MGKATILIVEDEAIVAADLASKLRQLGYDVVGTAAEGGEAIALAGRLRPQLVLMDIWLMGPLDGIAVAEAMCREYDLPVVYLTAHSDPATLARAKLTGPFGYILKPFEERELATQIELALYKFQADRELRQQREWLRVVLTSIGDAVIATDDKGRIAFVNLVAETLTGWTAEDAVGRPVQEVLCLVDQCAETPLDELVSRVLDERQPVTLANQATLRRKDGRLVPIEDSAAPMRDAAGKVIGAVLVFRDVTEKRRAEEALRRAKEDWEETFNTVPDCVAILDTEHRIVRANQSMARRLNLTPEECVGAHCYALVHGTACPPGNCPHANSCRNGQEQTVELEEAQLHTNFLITTTPRFDAHGNVVGTVHVARDITRLKEVERALQRLNADLERRVAEQTVEVRKSYDIVKTERQRFYDLLETLPVYVVLLTSDYHVYFANRYFRERFGETQGESCFEHLFHRAVPCDECRLTDVLSDGAPRRWELTFADGRVYDVYGFPFRNTDGSHLVLEMGIDITERRQAEAALRAKERSLVEAQRIGHLGNWEWDVVTDHLQWSDEAYRIFGREPQPSGVTYAAFLAWAHPADRARMEQAASAALADPRAQYSVEHRVVQPDGTERIVQERGEVTFADDGRPLRMFGTVHDITDRRRAEQETLRMKGELAHVERAARMGELAASLAHEISQPLTAILSNAQAARRFAAASAPDLDLLREILDDIIRDDKRAGSVIHGLRAMLQKGKTELEAICLNDAVREVAQLLHSEIVGCNAILTLDLTAPPADVQAGRVEIQQVLVNLILNALDAVRDQSSDRRKIRIRTYLASPSLVVAVEDRGCGIPLPDTTDIFEPFYTTKSTGLGMGLAICRRIVENYGGRIWAENNERMGATIAFALPVTPDGEELSQ
jgi:PAS domain S-box-containing protein